MLTMLSTVVVVGASLILTLLCDVVIGHWRIVNPNYG